MRLEHINLVVSDLDKTLTFYQAAFPHWHVRGQGQMNWYGKDRRWLHFGDDEQYITFNDGGEGENRDLSSQQLGLAHFAFTTSNLQSLIDRLKQAGFTRSSGGKQLTGRRNAYFIDPTGFEVEFVQYTADDPAIRNLYEDE
ncbi:VOC family protein [Thalassotalea sp. Y01]|uniref:VOC family protein n=1 Tax=Thalassotalea sp. Y01 TaxID=2729613 RepID=UPI00145DAD1F|nr:VOC family protein [Thalassotalea sp. Y01]NMP15570.1 VOC family protein [Thalassotalea sp. Y01]